ncbi:hypothetical protein EBR21_05585 [bacterium]|nr:hypothetical protein [bacterium]
MKKILSFLLVLAMFHVQGWARASQGTLDNSFAQMATDISNGKLDKESIVNRAMDIVGEAKASGVSEEEFIGKMSQKLALNMSDADVAKTVAELKEKPSTVKIDELASQLSTVKSGEKFLLVLLTFALLSALWIGIFFLIADPHYPR